MSTATLERVVRRARSRAPAAQERCELCSAPVPPAHGHMLDLERHQIVCSCHACTLLFDRPGAITGGYRLIPTRRVRLQIVDTSAIGVPVSLAFFVLKGDGSVEANYPSPAGATQWDVDAEAWQRFMEQHPQVGELAPDVEALLVNAARGRKESWIVPLDDCYRLAGLVRASWEGLSGGDRVWVDIDRFFEELSEHG